MGGRTSTISTSETKAEAFQLQSSAYGVTIPVLYGTARIAPNLLDYGDFRAIAHTDVEETGGKGGGGGVRTESTTYTYSASIVLGVVMGEEQMLGAGWWWYGKLKMDPSSGPLGTGITFFKGDLDQPVWSVLNTMHGGAHARNYSGLALMCIQDLYLGGTPSMDNHNIEVYGPGSFVIHGTIADADPSRAAYGWFCNPKIGLAQPATLLGDLTYYRDYCRAAGLWMSPLLTEQAPATDRFDLLTKLTNSTIVVADGKINFVPLGMESLSNTIPASGSYPEVIYTYEPDPTPLYSLTPDHLLDRDDLPLVTVRRKRPSEAYNIVEVEFTDRANDYAVGRTRARDRTSIDLYGAKPAPTVSAPWIMSAEVAAAYAWLQLQKYLQVLREYEFDLPWQFDALAPSSIVLLTDPDWELEEVPVRITSLKESDQGYSVEAEDCPGSVSSVPTFGLPVMDGFRQDYGALPGDTVVAAVFEAPYELAAGLEVWLAVAGSESAWGGCHVWVSVDGVEYKRVTSVWGATRSGALSAPMVSTATGMSVDGMTGLLLSGSALDASIGATLCYIGGANPEYVAFQTATLTGAGAYTLSDVVRGVYGSRAAAHLDNTPFIRCDEAVAKSGPLGLGLIGRQIYIKCQSFNVFGLAEQDLSDITALAYAVTGRYAVPIDEPVNLCAEGSFNLLPLGQRPGTWNSGAVTAVVGQPFSRALSVSSEYTEEFGARFGAVAGDRFHVTGLLSGSTGVGATGLGIRFYGADDAPAGFVAAGTTVAAAGAWAARSGVVVAPTGSAYAVAAINRASGSTGISQAAEIVVRRQAKTLELVDNAATVVYVATEEPAFGVGTSIAEIIFTPEVDCVVVVEMQCIASCDPGSRTDAFMAFRAACQASQYNPATGYWDSLTGSGQTFDSSERLIQYQAIARPISRSSQFTLIGGRQVSVSMRFSNRTIANIDAAASNCKVQAEVIKR